MFNRWLTQVTEQHDVFLFLLDYHWLSLPPPLVALVATANQGNARWVFIAACVDNFILTLFHPRVNRLVLRSPIVFAVDLFIIAAFIMLTGGVASPYYLYAPSPLLTAAFFFQMRGALVTATALTIFYSAALLSNAPVDLVSALTQISSFFLIAILFGYSSILIERIRRDRADQQQNTKQHKQFDFHSRFLLNFDFTSTVSRCSVNKL